MTEYAIICTFSDGERSVNYIAGSYNDAVEEAKNSARISCAENVVIAKVCAFISDVIE